jgi:hypothetical protein
MVINSRPVGRFHSFITKSSPTLASVRPSGDTAKALRRPL